MIKKICNYITFILVLFFFPLTIQAAEIKPYLVHDAFEINVPSDIKTYFYKTTQINYQSGKVVLSLNPNGSGEALVGESIHIVVDPGDGYFEVFNINPDCSVRKIPPLDITHMLYKGTNSIRVGYRKECGPGIKKHDPLYIVHFDDYEPSTEPFLDLPWDYRSKNMSFDDAAMAMTAYFDHEYPILSAKWFLSEPENLNFNIIDYKAEKSQKPYSSHDGYDYAAPSNAFLNDPVLAAATGTATFHNNCSACGNAIHINHGNGYQTRYYHLQSDGLIINNPNTSINVTARQQIGKIGQTGRAEGAHIHFMVIMDKNSDGNFEDNIPDGLVDPYGWHGDNPDPWETFSFEQNGIQKTGVKSNYLWKTKLTELNKTLSPEGSVVTGNRFTFNFPSGATSKYLIFSVKPVPVSEPSAALTPIGYIVDATANDGFGNFITQFNKLFTISMKILLTDYTRFKPESLSIYSSSDGENWLKENTTVDLLNRTAATQVNHLTQFAFMGEKKDSIPPVTQMRINNEITSETIFFEPVSISFNTTDEPTADSLGIESTFYKIKDEEWQAYSTPILLDEFKEYTISYYSIDKDGNAEEIKQTKLEIKEAILNIPEIQVEFDTNTAEFILSSVHPDHELTIEPVIIKKKSYNQYSVSNLDKSTSLMTLLPDKNEKDIIKFYSVQYDENDPILLSKFKFVVFNKVNKKDVEKLIQIFQQGDEERIRLTYNNIKDISTIVMKRNGEIVSKEIVNGFKQLIIRTQDKKLQFSIQ